MKVLVTGGTGFVGSHVTRAALAAGHQVRLLARTPAKIKNIEIPNGFPAPEIAPGDMLDPASVASAAGGCDAVIHCAAEIGVPGVGGPRGAASVNLAGARNVFEAARDAGCDPVLYTSSISAFLPAQDPVVTAGSPLAEPLSVYGASKRDAEALAAKLRSEKEVPVTSLVLGAVYGPDSPGTDGGAASITGAMGSMMLAPPGGVGVIDVRDVAELAAALLVPGRPARRIMAGGRFVTWPEWTACLSGACGREVPFSEVSADDMRALGRDMDARRAAGEEVPPLSEEAAVIMAAGRPSDDAEALAVLGREWRPTLETFRDTVAFLRRTGRLPS